MGVVERNPQRQVSPQNGSKVMKKVLSFALMILCVGVFAFGDADARPGKPPKPPGPKPPEQVNGVSRINASGDILGVVELSDEAAACPTDETTFKILVYVAGQSIVARPVLNVDGNYGFVLYNVPVPVGGSVDVTAELFDATRGVFSTKIEPVPLAKHTVTKMEAPIVIECQAAPTQ
jgi:hypothetical protein